MYTPYDERTEMSDLPEIDPLKLAERKIQRLSAELAQSKDFEIQLELLAEALRDERDDALTEVAHLKAAATPVENITALP
jgi:hypothetical protein